MKYFFNQKISIIFFLFSFLAILVGLFGSGFIRIDNSILIQDNLLPLNKVLVLENDVETERILELYLQRKLENSDRWMTFMTILSTIFAVFFVWAGFKIENVKENLVWVRKDVKDTMEFWIQLQYCMSFIIQKQYDKAIDSLEVLRKESFVWYDSKNFNVCNFFIAHCYYEKGSKDDLAIAVDYVNQMYEDSELNPFKEEVIAKFEELDKIEEGKNI